jgi:hypothetical protein
MLIDTLNFKAKDFGARWKAMIRRSPHLKHYQTMSDEELVADNERLYPVLARSLERGIDRSHVGDFFVKLGKTRMEKGFPVSELVFALSLSHQTVIEYLMSDFVLDSTVRMYQAMGVMTKVAEFFHLSAFYVTKGFLEETYTHMSKHHEISEEILKKYFRDDFFFKKSD